MSIVPLVPAVIGLARPVQAVAKSAVSSFASALQDFVGSSQEIAQGASTQGAELSRPTVPLLDGFGTPLGLEGIRSQTEAALQQLQIRLKSLFEQSGIDPLQTARLSVQSDGRLAVSADHPQSQQIEELINGDTELAASLREVIANLEVLRAVDQNQEFAAAYQRDPGAAVAQFAELLDERNGSPLDLLFDIQGLGPDA